jgi:dTDP-4-dehydrorhamnose reductase
MPESKVAVTGPAGRLGRALVERGCEALHCDILKVDDLRAEIDRVQPEVIINCAAYTDVDGAEESKNRERAIAVNTRGPGVLRQQFDGLILHLSTGYIFSGKSGPYAENAIPEPVNFYGMTKLGGEMASRVRDGTMIVRTLDLFGPTLEGRPDFVRQVRDLLEFGESFTLPSGLYGSPTYIPHLAEAILILVDRRIGLDPWTTIWHIAGDMVLSRFRWGQLIAKEFGLNEGLIQPSDEVKGPAPRPMRGGLMVDKAKAAFVPIHSPLEGLRLLADLEVANA